MSHHSAGILLYRYRDRHLEVLLVHPGGPYWSGKDLGAWSIPKGLFDPEEDPLAAARREFREETGFDPDGDFLSLGKVKQPSGKIVHAWALEGELDVNRISSNTFTMEWPPHSGKMERFPEIDRGEWFDLDVAKTKITRGQRQLLERLISRAI